MKIVGQILKQNRIQKGITLNEVAISTKINLKTLTLIEEGQADRLPPKTFLRGFVKSYATYLGLNVDEILKTFHEEMGPTSLKSQTPVKDGLTASELNTSATEGISHQQQSQEPNLSASNEVPWLDQMLKKIQIHSERILTLWSGDRPGLPPQESLEREHNWRSRLVIAIGIVVVSGLLLIVKVKMDRYADEKALAGAPPVLETANKNDLNLNKATQPLAGDSPTPAPNPPAVNSTPKSEDQPAVLATSSPVVVQTPTLNVPTPTPKLSPTPIVPVPTPSPTVSPGKVVASPTPLPSPTVTPAPTPVATPVATPSAKPTATPISNPSPSPTPDKKASDPAQGRGPVDVLIEALDSVDLNLTIDSDKSITLHLNPDQVHAIKAKRKVSLKVSDGGAVNLVVNGRDRGVPGDLGKPIKIDLP